MGHAGCFRYSPWIRMFHREHSCHQTSNGPHCMWFCRSGNTTPRKQTRPVPTTRLAPEGGGTWSRYAIGDHIRSPAGFHGEPATVAYESLPVPKPECGAGAWRLSVVAAEFCGSPCSQAEWKGAGPSPEQPFSPELPPVAMNSLSRPSGMRRIPGAASNRSTPSSSCTRVMLPAQVLCRS